MGQHVYLGGAQTMTAHAKPRVCVVAASDATVRVFLAPHLRAMQSLYELTVVVNTHDAALLSTLGVAGTLIPIRLERRAAPWRDLSALAALYRLMRRGRFDIVHSMTPKAGLLAMAAAWLARIPLRIHTFTGQVWATRRGIARGVLRACDRVIVRLATTTLADSPSQRDFLIREGVASRAGMIVLGNGSVSGVDTTRFRPDPVARSEIRRRFNVPSSDLVLLLLGRLTAEKGVMDLVSAFGAIADTRCDVHLWLIGSDEDALRSRLQSMCAPHAARVRFLEFTERPQDVMAAADVLCLPSYREGFGSVVIEAAACGVPAVASRIYGLVDAVEDGRTGLLHAPGDIADLTDALRRVVDDRELRLSLGMAARRRVEADFPVQRLTEGVLDLYARLLNGPNARRRTRESWYGRYGKRAIDVAVSTFALIALSPLFAALAVIIRFTLGAPVLFRQLRPGLMGRPFTLVKFRSMTDRYDERGRLLPDGERLTSFGRFLRSTSLDELPELWNVLSGDMSLIGPRPLLMEYLARYSPRQAARHSVKPGITGLAQVTGRNELPWDQRFELDLLYAERLSLSADLKIILRTVRQVVSRRGISQAGHATAPEFR
jgi:lipopolysaccharide/colanic/teichoic acid biosynthesis glycosyltransferase/glycosyltransferase involved in cell wall biosynthesis